MALSLWGLKVSAESIEEVMWGLDSGVQHSINSMSPHLCSLYAIKTLLGHDILASLRQLHHLACLILCIHHHATEVARAFHMITDLKGSPARASLKEIVLSVYPNQNTGLTLTTDWDVMLCSAFMLDRFVILFHTNYVQEWTKEIQDSLPLLNKRGILVVAIKYCDCLEHDLWQSGELITGKIA